MKTKMDIKQIREQIEAIAFDPKNTEDWWDVESTIEQGYYTLWIISEINRCKVDIPAPEISFNRTASSIILLWDKSETQKVEVRIAMEGKIIYIQTTDEGENVIRFTKHDYINKGSITEYLRCIYE